MTAYKGSSGSNSLMYIIKKLMKTKCFKILMVNNNQNLRNSLK